MKIEEALIRLRDDLKECVTNNLNAIGKPKASDISIATPEGMASTDVQGAIGELRDILRIKTYHDISQFGCTSTFIPDIAVAMPQHSYFCKAVTSVDNGIGANADNKFPYTSGVLTIEKASSYVRVMFTGCNSGASDGNIYLANINLNTKVLNKWHQFTGDLSDSLKESIGIKYISDLNIDISSMKYGLTVHYYTNQTMNTPVVAWGFVVTLRIAGSSAHQFTMFDNSNRLYHRTYSNSVWSNTWQSVSFT